LAGQLDFAGSAEKVIVDLIANAPQTSLSRPVESRLLSLPSIRIFRRVPAWVAELKALNADKGKPVAQQISALDKIGSWRRLDYKRP
jgi:hypothetical protein